MKRLFSILAFFRIYDPARGTLSLTDLGTWLALVKIAWVRQPSLVDLTALVAMFLAQGHKKYIAAKTNGIQNGAANDNHEAEFVDRVAD